MFHVMISSVNHAGCVGFVYLCDFMSSITKVRLVSVSLEFLVVSDSCDLLLIITRVEEVHKSLKHDIDI